MRQESPTLKYESHNTIDEPKDQAHSQFCPHHPLSRVRPCKSMVVSLCRTCGSCHFHIERILRYRAAAWGQRKPELRGASRIGKPGWYTLDAEEMAPAIFAQTLAGATDDTLRRFTAARPADRMHSNESERRMNIWFKLRGETLPGPLACPSLGP